MDYAFEAPPLRGANRDHVTVVALRDVIIAALAAASAQNALQRLLQIFARACDSLAHAPQCRRGIVADFRVGENGPADGSRKEAQICERAGALGEQREFCGGVAKDCA